MKFEFSIPGLYGFYAIVQSLKSGQAFDVDERDIRDFASIHWDCRFSSVSDQEVQDWILYVQEEFEVGVRHNNMKRSYVIRKL